MYDEMLNGQERWHQFIDEADEYRRARKVEVGKKKSKSVLRSLLTQFTSIFSS